ncbi:spermidine synthase [Ochrobactrum sp. POC9]|uniref:spermidine synthase n=1 Tax=Ochrobactrum sp. POC9 TaxID=2203419 RepID=UPI0025707E0F|nr:hypothetical protein [Ochrobactrum sp. POC9]
MTIWAEVAKAGNLAGDEILLRKRDRIYEIRYNGLELMSNVNFQSETVLAERSLRLHGRQVSHMLIGGLGMGFTLRAALDLLGPDARVTVCELVPEIVGWNRTHIGHLADHPLNDPRVDVRVADVMDVLRAEPGRYDAILMDTDNGPDFTVRAANGVIYEDDGLRLVKRALKPNGIAAFWSATISNPFEDKLDMLSWEWQREDISLIGGRADAFHYIYFAARGGFRSPFERVVSASEPFAVMMADREGSSGQSSGTARSGCAS